MRNDFITRLGPVNELELALVDRMVRATWNQRRAWDAAGRDGLNDD